MKNHSVKIILGTVMIFTVFVAFIMTLKYANSFTEYEIQKYDNLSSADALNRTSLKLIDISLSTKPQAAKKLFEEFDNNCYTWNSYDAVKSKNTDFIQTQREVISGLSYSDAENLLGLLYRIENSADNNIDYYNFIKDISDKMLKK